MRLVLALLAATATSALGAVILGEYELTGLMPYVASVLFAVAVAEVALAVGGSLPVGAAAAVGVAVAAGLAWAAWIQAAHDLDYVPAATKLGLVVGAATAVVWLRSAGTRGSRTPPPPSP